MEQALVDYDSRRAASDESATAELVAETSICSAGDAGEYRGGDYRGGDRALALSVSIFVASDALRAQLAEEALSLGFRLAHCGQLREIMAKDGVFSLGDIVIAECTDTSAESLAALARLDIRAAQSGAQIILATQMEMLDSVFGLLDQSQPQILVNPTGADRILAMGSAIAGLAESRLRELGDDERVLLLKLTEEVGRIAREVENLSGRFDVERGAATLHGPKDNAYARSGAQADHDPKIGWGGSSHYDPDELQDYVTPQQLRMPDPVLVRRIIRMRQMRGRYFDSQQFSDPAWDILLDLTAARAERKRVSVTSLCIASGVRPTTALRWISQMTDAGMLERMEDPADRRRAFIRLGEITAEAMAHYFHDIVNEGILAI